MIEKIVSDYLSSALDIPVLMEEPLTKHESYVLIEKISSSKENHIDSCVIAIQSYGETLYKTAKLNEDVKNAMENISSLENVSCCELNSDYNFTDTVTKRYRYQAIFDIVYFD